MISSYYEFFFEMYLNVQYRKYHATSPRALYLFHQCHRRKVPSKTPQSLAQRTENMQRDYNIWNTHIKVPVPYTHDIRYGLSLCLYKA